jgi:DUF2945 family protein
VSDRFMVGDHVTWNSEAGHVSGTIIKVHTQDVITGATPTMPARTSLSMKSRATRPITSRCTKDLR